MKITFKDNTHEILKKKFVNKKTFRYSLVIHLLQGLGNIYLLYKLFI